MPLFISDSSRRPTIPSIALPRNQDPSASNEESRICNRYIDCSIKKSCYRLLPIDLQGSSLGRLVQSPTEEFRLVGCRLRTLDFVIGYVIPDIEYTVHALIYLIDIFPASSKVEAPAFFLDDMQRSFSNGFDLKLKGFKTATVIGNKTVRYQTKSNYWLVTYEFD
ncbi:hypothetical protein L1887_14967 [Cichorium endivia]|nr:hypothetical protein L1887_14967 [Cichorium endivia]